MDKTNILVKFAIIGDDFDVEMISDQLNMKPTECYNKGDKIKNREIVRKETCWSISTGYETSLDMNDQLEKILHLIKPKRNVLMELREEFQLYYKFIVVINIEENQSPGIFLDQETIEFANAIKAEFDFDLYVFS